MNQKQKEVYIRKLAKPLIFKQDYSQRINGKRAYIFIKKFEQRETEHGPMTLDDALTFVESIA